MTWLPRCGERKRSKTPMAASGLYRHGKESALPERLTQDASHRVGCGEVGSGMGALVAWARAARCETASRWSRLLCWWGCVWATRLPARIARPSWGLPHCCVCFQLQCNLEGLCLLPTRHSRSRSANRTHGVVFSLRSCSALVGEETVFWTLEAPSCVWFTADDLTSYVA